MSLLQFDLPEEAIADKTVRRALITAVCDRIPTGAGRGQRHVKKGREVSTDSGRRLLVEGASEEVCADLGIPPEWASRCEDARHDGHDGTSGALGARLERHLDRGSINPVKKWWWDIELDKTTGRYVSARQNVAGAVDGDDEAASLCARVAHASWHDECH
jgi:hypothetical protein